MTNLKKAIVALLGCVTAAFGWFGWLVIAFVGCLTLDYLTGTIAAGRKGEWKSETARSGLWHKLGSIVAVCAAAIVDGVLGLIVNNIPGISLPFNYTVLVCPVVVLWYIFTELGSIAENAEKLGAPVPPFLRKILAVCKDATEDVGGKIGE